LPLPIRFALSILSIAVSLCASVAAATLSHTATGYVGSAACAGCHQAESEAWRGSHHDLAMAEATEETVLGDFDSAAFT
jgi:cytochrome c551/c552